MCGERELRKLAPKVAIHLRCMQKRRAARAKHGLDCLEHVSLPMLVIHDELVVRAALVANRVSRCDGKVLPDVFRGQLRPRQLSPGQSLPGERSVHIALQVPPLSPPAAHLMRVAAPGRRISPPPVHENVGMVAPSK